MEMSEHQQILVGDMVGISIDAEGNAWIEGKVLCRPNGTGDAWVIESKHGGDLFYVQQYHYMKKFTA